MTSSTTGPLAGVHVLDITTTVSGPTATLILAGLGADVLKVERPGAGDDCREMPPHDGTWGSYFVAVNRGKRSLVLDLSRTEGVDVLLRIARTCDVFVENFRGGKAEAMGLGEDALRAARPDMIYASLSAFGPRGPDLTRPGYDALLQARTGILSVTGSEDGAMARTGVSILDMGSGVWLALGVLGALLERTRSGRGQRVDASLYQTGVMWMGYHLVSRQFTGRDPKPQGTRIGAFAPYGDFAAADGRIFLGISNDRLFARLCEAVERPDWVSDPRFATNRARVENRIEMDRELEAVLRSRAAADWLDKLNRFGIPAGPIQTAGDVLTDPQLAALQQMEQVDLGDATVLAPRLPVELSLAPQPDSGPPPRLGQHGREILAEAGFYDGEIAELARDGIVQLP